MRRWFSDGAFRAVLRNAGYLASGKMVAALLGLISLACAGRGMTPLLFGTLMVIHTYALGAGALVKFQTWQFVVRFGTPALQRGDTDFTQDTIRFAFGLDIASGLVGMILAMVALPLLARELDIASADLTLAVAYCTIVPTMSAATAVGVLRLLDRFDLIGAQQTVTPICRALGATISYFGGFGFTGFVLTWYLSDLAGDIALWGLAARELKRRGMLGALRPGLVATARRLPKAWGFVWTTNIAQSINSAWGPLGNLVVAATLGPVAAGLYKIAGTLMDSTSKPASMLSKGFYPEIMRLDPASTHPWKLGLRFGAIAAGLGCLLVLLVIVGGKPAIGFIFGHKYEDAYDLLRLMALSMVLSTAAFPLESLLYMVDRQRVALIAQALSALAYLGLLYWLTQAFGLHGAGVAYLIGTSLMTVLMLGPVIAAYRQRARFQRHLPVEPAEL